MTDSSALIHLYQLLVLLATVLAFVVGACVGSFVNCAALRRGTGESVLRGRSCCPHCKHVLGPLEIVPILSWLVQKGRCKHCNEKLSVRYPLTEAGLGLIYAALVVVHAGVLVDAGLHTLLFMVFAAILLYASLVDLDSRIIPDACIIAAVVAWAVYLVLAGPVLGHIDALAALRFSAVGAFGITIPLVLVVLVADRVFGQESMGGGDIKLFFVAGLYFGWQQCLFLIIVACVLGIAGALVAQRVHGGTQGSTSFRKQQIPFGPAIALACVIIMLVGGPFMSWYGSFL